VTLCTCRDEHAANFQPYPVKEMSNRIDALESSIEGETGETTRAPSFLPLAHASPAHSPRASELIIGVSAPLPRSDVEASMSVDARQEVS
jgi:hypothetical protein